MSDRCIRHVLMARDGTRIAYHTHLGAQPSESALGSRPTVLLTNGVGTPENFWRFLVADLVEEHRIIHWSYRGHATSGLAATGDYGLAAHVDDLARVTRAVMARGDGRPPHQVAFSMGVRVVLELYRRHPELVPSLTLIAGSARAPGILLLRVPGSASAMRWAMDVGTPLVPVLAPFLRVLLGSRLAVPAGRALGLLRARAPRGDIEAFLEAVSRMDAAAYWKSLRGLLDGDSSDVLPTIRVPTQVVAAANDTLVPLEEVARLHAGIPGARWLRVEDAGHAGLVEAGAEMAAGVRFFLRSLAPAPYRSPARRARGLAAVLPLRPGGAPANGP